MNKARWIFAAVILFAFVFSLSIAADLPAGKIKIGIPGAATKPYVAFDHAAHLKAAGGKCRTCHHANPEGTGGKCTTCHTAKGTDIIPRARTAFHDACHNCHKKARNGELDTAPKGKSMTPPVYPKDCIVCHAK